MTITEFIQHAGLTMTATPAEANPNMAADEKWMREASHWTCQVSKGDAYMNVPFSQGRAHKSPPTLEDVLDSLASDAMGAHEMSFEEWAGQFDYSTDSRKAERIYNTILKQSALLHNLLGEADYRMLCLEVERL